MRKKTVTIYKLSKERHDIERKTGHQRDDTKR